MICTLNRRPPLPPHFLTLQEGGLRLQSPRALRLEQAALHVHLVMGLHQPRLSGKESIHLRGKGGEEWGRTPYDCSPNLNLNLILVPRNPPPSLLPSTQQAKLPSRLVA